MIFCSNLLFCSDRYSWLLLGGPSYLIYQGLAIFVVTIKNFPYTRPGFGLDKGLTELWEKLAQQEKRLMMQTARDIRLMCFGCSFGTEAVQEYYGEIWSSVPTICLPLVFATANSHTGQLEQLGRMIGQGGPALSKQTFVSLSSCCHLTLSIYALGTPLSYLYTSDSTAIEASVLVTLFLHYRTSLLTAGHCFWLSAGFGKCSSSTHATSIRYELYPCRVQLLMITVLGLGLAWYLGWNAFWIMVSVGSSLFRYRYQAYMTSKG